VSTLKGAARAEKRIPRAGKKSSAQPGPSVRERLLDAAFEAFMEHGYAGASTLDIATRAKVSKRDLYAHFRNKEALFAAGIEARAGRMQNPVALPAVADLASLAAALRTYGAATLAGVTDAGVLGVFRLAIAESARAPELARALERFGREPNRRVLLDILSKARGAGLLADGDLANFAEEFLGLLWGTLQTSLFLRAAVPPSAKAIERRAERAATAFIALRGGRGDE